jgi:hypothetical protein
LCASLASFIYKLYPVEYSSWPLAGSFVLAVRCQTLFASSVKVFDEIPVRRLASVSSIGIRDLLCDAQVLLPGVRDIDYFNYGT